MSSTSLPHSLVLVAQKDRDAVFLHYTWWTCQWDEWVKVPSDRLAPHGTKVCECTHGVSDVFGVAFPLTDSVLFPPSPDLPGGVLRVGQVIEVFDDHPTINKWSEGSVVEESPDQVKVHFKGFVAKFDKWFPRNSPYLSPFGVHRRLRHPHIRRVPRILIEAQLTSFHGALAKKDMRVVRCDPDGNCLFRAASHQIYGTEAHHALVRERTLDYMEVWKTHFSAFTVGNLDLFPEYVKWKRANAVWGDEPEVQAISELYGRYVCVCVCVCVFLRFCVCVRIHCGFDVGGDMALPIFRVSGRWKCLRFTLWTAPLSSTGATIRTRGSPFGSVSTAAATTTPLSARGLQKTW